MSGRSVPIIPPAQKGQKEKDKYLRIIETKIKRETKKAKWINGRT